MKTLKKILLHLILVSLLSAFMLYRGYRSGEQTCNESWQVVADSMQAIASLPPDILVIHDTIWPANDTIFVYKNLPVPVPDAADTNRYQDTVVTEMFTLWIDDLVKGTLLDRSIKYNLAAPLVIHDSIKIYINKPYPVYPEIKKPAPRSHWIATAGIGGNYNGTGWSVGALYVNKYCWMYGAEYLRIGNNGHVMLKVGYKL